MKSGLQCPICGSYKVVQTMRGVSTLVYQESKINEDGSVEFPKDQTQMEYKCINDHYFYPKDETKIESKVIYNDKPLTKRQCAIISTYTGIMLGKWEWTHEYIEEIMGRPVFTHELANRVFYSKVQEKARPDFMAINDNAIGYNAPLGDK